MVARREARALQKWPDAIGTLADWEYDRLI